MTSPSQAQARPSIIVHGGAGNLDADRLPRCRSGCEAAARAGYAILERGGSALDAVEAAVRVLEDDDEFNAGFGAVLNREGTVEVDAGIMDGTLRAGGVAAVPWLRHPVTLARRILDEGHHILLVADGALGYARSHGIGAEMPGSLVTPRSRARWEKETHGRIAPASVGDTVGALAFDRAGGLAAASSTGGTSFKRPGRVGDSPIPGAGLYAEDGRGAATATGHGESILRVSLCKSVVDSLVELTPIEAARRGIEQTALRTAGMRGGTCGVIVLDGSGRPGHFRDSAVMPWAQIVGGDAASGT